MGFSFREEKIEVVIFGWDFAVILNDTLSALSKYVPYKKNSTLNFRSTITGVPNVKRDKYSVFNFLNFTSNEPIEEKSVSQDSEMKALPAPETKQGLLSDNLVF